MPSATELKKMFSKKYILLPVSRRTQPIYNPGEDNKPLTWEDIKTLVTDENLDYIYILQALYHANLIK